MRVAGLPCSWTRPEGPAPRGSDGEGDQRETASPRALHLGSPLLTGAGSELERAGRRAGTRATSRVCPRKDQHAGSDERPWEQRCPSLHDGVCSSPAVFI